MKPLMITRQNNSHIDAKRQRVAQLLLVPSMRALLGPPAPPASPAVSGHRQKTNRDLHNHPNHGTKYREAVGSFGGCKLARIHCLHSHDTNTFFLYWDERWEGFK